MLLSIIFQGYSAISVSEEKDKVNPIFLNAVQMFLIITDSDHVILTYLQSETVANRLNNDGDELDIEEEESDE